MPVNMSFFQKRRWLVEFGVVCLVPIVLLGLFLMQTLKANVSGRAISNAREQARLVADVGVATPLSGDDDLTRGLTSSQQQMLDRQLATIGEGNGLRRVVVRTASGHVVYADDKSLIGQDAAPGGARNAAIGNIGSDLANTPQGKVLRVFVPLRIGSGPAVGSTEVWLPYGPI